MQKLTKCVFIVFDDINFSFKYTMNNSLNIYMVKTVFLHLKKNIFHSTPYVFGMII